MINSQQAASDRRRHRRMPVKLVGRYMLPDKREYPCETIDISPDGLLLNAGICPYRGQRIIAYLEALGRVEGVVIRVVRSGFAMNIMATSRRREKLFSSLTWIGNSQEVGTTNQWRSERIIPARSLSMLTLANRTPIPALIEDFSTTGRG